MKFSQRRVARPMIARNGGTHLVDLAVSDPTNGSPERGRMEEVYSSTDDNGNSETVYRPMTNDARARDSNRAGMAWPFGGSFGAGEVIVSETKPVEDGEWQEYDVQPEPGEADGEGQNAKGNQTTQATKMPSRRTGGIG